MDCSDRISHEINKQLLGQQLCFLNPFLALWTGCHSIRINTSERCIKMKEEIAWPCKSIKFFLSTCGNLSEVVSVGREFCQNARAFQKFYQSSKHGRVSWHFTYYKNHHIHFKVWCLQLFRCIFYEMLRSYLQQEDRCFKSPILVRLMSMAGKTAYIVSLKFQ